MERKPRGYYRVTHAQHNMNMVGGKVAMHKWWQCLAMNQFECGRRKIEVSIRKR